MALALWDLRSLVTTHPHVCHPLQAGDHSHWRGRCALLGDYSQWIHLTADVFTSTIDLCIKKLDLDIIFTFFPMYHLQKKKPQINVN